MFLKKKNNIKGVKKGLKHVIARIDFGFSVQEKIFNVGNDDNEVLGDTAIFRWDRKRIDPQGEDGVIYAYPREIMVIEKKAENLRELHQRVECIGAFKGYDACNGLPIYKLESENIKVISSTIFKEKNYLDCFNEVKPVGLIATQDELEDYYSSSLSFDEWNHIKAVKKMKSIGLDDGFICEFAYLVSSDIDKYNSLDNIAKECSNIDLLKYMFLYKCGKSK